MWRVRPVSENIEQNSTTTPASAAQPHDVRHFVGVATNGIFGRKRFAVFASETGDADGNNIFVESMAEVDRLFFENFPSPSCVKEAEFCIRKEPARFSLKFQQHSDGDAVAILFDKAGRQIASDGYSDKKFTGQASPKIINELLEPVKGSTAKTGRNFRRPPPKPSLALFLFWVR